MDTLFKKNYYLIECWLWESEQAKWSYGPCLPDPGRKKPVKELDFQEHKKGMGKKADNHHRMSFKESETNIWKNLTFFTDSPLLRRETSFIDATDSEDDSETGMVSNTFLFGSKWHITECLAWIYDM